MTLPLTSNPPTQRARSDTHGAQAATVPVAATACGRWAHAGRRLLCLLIPLALAACASVLRVDSEVQSAERWPAAPQAPQRYQFERSPLQTQGAVAEQLTQLQGLVREALARQGWSDASGAVVFESRATHLGPWSASPGIWRALVNSVLDGFPHPPPGPRQVVIEVPR